MRPARAANPYEYGADADACSVLHIRTRDRETWIASIVSLFAMAGSRVVPESLRFIRATSFTQRTATIVVAREGRLRRVLPLIERNILMILFRHRIPVTRGHGATIDRTVDLLLPGHPGRLLFLRRHLLLFRSRVLSSRVFRSLVFRGLVFRGLGFRRGSGRCRWRGSAARRALRQRDAGRQEYQSRRRRGHHNTRQFLHRKLRFWPAPFPARPYYVRCRPHTGILATRMGMDWVCLARLQVVKTKASRLHCQSGPRAALAAGSGWDTPITTKPMKASATTAARSTRFLRVHQLWGMAVAPV